MRRFLAIIPTLLLCLMFHLPTASAAVATSDSANVEQRKGDVRIFSGTIAAPTQETSPTSGGKLIARGWEEFNAGNYNAAGELFSTARIVADVRLDATFGLAICAMVKGETDVALPLFLALVEEEFQLEKTLPELLSLLIARKEYEKASEYLALTDLLDENKSKKGLERALFLGEFLQTRQSRTIADDLLFVTEHDDMLSQCRNPDIFKEFAERFVSAGQESKAISVYRALLNCSTDEGYRLGLLYALKPLISAKELLTLCEAEKQRSSISPKHIETIHDLQLEVLYALLTEEPTQVQNIAPLILAINPNDRSALTALGWNYLENKQFQQAYDAFVKISLTDTQNLDHIVGMIYASSGMKDFDRALMLIDTHREAEKIAALEKEIKLQSLWAKVSSLESGAPELESLATEIITLDPEDRGIRQLRAWWYYNKGDLQSAGREFSALYRDDPAGQDHAYGLAVSLYRLENHAEALAVVDDNEAYDPRLSELRNDILTALCRAAFDEHRCQDVTAYCRQLLALDADNATAQELLETCGKKRFDPESDDTHGGGHGHDYPADWDDNLIIALPGYLWGSVFQDIVGSTGLGWAVIMQQGIDWLKLPNDIVLNTYVEARYQDRSEDVRYFGETGQSIGVMLKKSVFKLGYEYTSEEYTEQDRTVRGGRGYLEWYNHWRIPHNQADGQFDYLATTGYTYGRIVNDSKNRTGTSISTHLNLGIDWLTVPHDFVFNTYFEYRMNSRTKDSVYYNSHGPVLGAELRRGNLRIGIDFFHEYLPMQHTGEKNGTIYIRWYHDWNLMTNR